MKASLVTLGLLASAVSGHIQMSKPYPIRSPLNKDADGKKDYSYTNPLSTDGSDYPCKGYADDPFNSVADYTPGQEYELELAGSATHKGGSCQIGLSYDKGETFHVIHSMIGGCPLTKKYNFKIPEDAPSGEALLSWTWFNKVGNREMYMNCAQVTVGGGNDGNSRMAHKQNARTLTGRAGGGFDNLPEIFQANDNGPGNCKTIEGKDVDFPKPGPSVEGSSDDKGYECEGSAPFLGDSKSPMAAASSHAAMSSAAATPASSHSIMASSPAASSSGSIAEASRIASMFGTHGSMRNAKANSGDGKAGGPWDHYPPWTRPHWPHPPHCHEGEVICAPDGLSFALCDHGFPHFMGPVAAGTICRHGHIV